MSTDDAFIRIMIKESDHERLVKYVTYYHKIHADVTEALDALENASEKSLRKNLDKILAAIRVKLPI
jgi:hypothetical protein